MCQDCKNTGIKRQDEEFGLDASVWCTCPIGEEKMRLVIHSIPRSLKEVAGTYL
jgi:hypothetical protein